MKSHIVHNIQNNNSARLKTLGENRDFRRPVSSSGSPPHKYQSESWS